MIEMVLPETEGNQGHESPGRLRISSHASSNNMI